MPHNITGVATHHATIPAPADGDNDEQASFDPAFQALADEDAFLIAKALGGVTTWPQVGQVQKVGLVNGKPNDVATYWGLTGVPSTLQWVSDGTNAGLLLFSIDAYLRSGQIITGFDAVVDPANARAGAARMSVELFYIPHDVLVPTNEPIAPVSIGSGFDDTTANKQRISVGSLAHTVDKTVNEYFLVVKAGGATAGIDRLYELQFTVTNPGPRSL